MKITREIIDSVKTDMSPYQLAKLIKVQGPMMYTYVNKGYISSYKTSTGKLAISKDEIKRFLESRLSKKESNV